MDNSLLTPLISSAQPEQTESLIERIEKKAIEYEKELISNVKTLTESDIITSIISKSGGSIIYSIKSGEIKELAPDASTSKNLWKETGDINLVQSFDEKYYCAYGSMSSIFLYTDDSRHVLDGHCGPVKSANFSDDGHFLISASLDKTSIIWKIDDENPCQLQHLVEHTGDVTNARISKNNDYALTSSKDKQIILWNASSGEIITRFRGHTSSVNDCIFSQDNSLIISGASDNTVRIWNIATKSIEATLRGHSDNVNLVENISADLVVSLGDLTIRIWNIKQKVAEAVLIGHTSSPTKIIITPDYFFSTSPDKTIRVWDKNSYSQTAKYMGHSDDIWGFAVSKDNKVLYSGGKDKLLKTWDIDESYLVGTLTGHPDFVIGVAVTKDKKWIISGGGGNKIFRWDASTMRKEREYEGHTNFVTRLQFVMNDRCFLSTSADRTLKMWDFESGEIIFSKTGHQGVVYFLSVLKDESSIITGSFDTKIKLWNFDAKDNSSKDFNYLKEYTAPIGNKKERGMILCFAISPDDKILISVGRDKCIRFWNIATLQEENAIDRKDYYEICVAISNDNTKFATGSQDYIIRLWNMKELCIIGLLEGHLDKIDGLVFLKSDSHLISGSSDTTLKIWNIGEMSLEVTLESHTDRVRNLCLTDDESLIISVSTDHTAKLWRYFIPPPEPDKINFQGIRDQWKGLFALTYLKAKPESWMKYIYLQPYRINRLHLYCYDNDQKNLEAALSKGFQLITTSEGEHPLSIAIKSNSANCIDTILSHLCVISSTRPFTFENAIMKISQFFPELLIYSPSNLKSFLNALMIESSEESLPNLGIPIEVLPKIILSQTYFINPQAFIKVESKESGKVPIKFYRSPFSWDLEIGSTKSIELLEAISKCKIIEIFETQFIKNLITIKWNQIWNFIFIQTILYWTTIVIFALSIFIPEHRVGYAITLLILNIVLSAYEIADMVSKFPYYFKDIINLIDLAVFSGTIAWCFLLIFFDTDPLSHDCYTFTWALALANSLRGITYFRTFEATRFYMRMITQAIADSYAFILILVYSTLCFGIIDYVSEPQNGTLDLSALLETIMKSYYLTLADFDRPTTALAKITFFVQSCINIIIIVNLLISILGSSYNSFESVAGMHNYKEMLEVIIEVERIMMWRRDQGLISNIHSCEIFKSQEIQDSIIYNIIKASEERIEKQNNIQMRQFENTMMTEFTRIRTDIGNVYSNQMRGNL